MPILLTGAAGFIGQHFAAMQPFIKQQVSEKLVCVDKVPNPPELVGASEYVSVDMTSVKEVLKMIDEVRPTCIVHLAGSTKVGESGDANTLILSNLLNSLDECGLRPHFIMAGSAAEYGDTPIGAPAPKEGAPLSPLDPYARSKVVCGATLQDFADKRRLPVAILRFANVYGPGQEGRFISLVLDAVANGAPVRLDGMGEPIRQFVYVNDICRALWMVVSQGVSGVFNLGGDELSMKHAAQAAVTAVHDFQLRRNIIPKPVLFDLRQEGGGAKRVVVDSTKAWSELGWTPLVSMYDGLRRTAAHRLQGEKYSEDQQIRRAS